MQFDAELLLLYRDVGFFCFVSRKFDRCILKITERVSIKKFSYSTLVKNLERKRFIFTFCKVIRRGSKSKLYLPSKKVSVYRISTRRFNTYTRCWSLNMYMPGCGCENLKLLLIISITLNVSKHVKRCFLNKSFINFTAAYTIIRRAGSTVRGVFSTIEFTVSMRLRGVREW